MFIVCEPISWGLEHVPFNAAFLKTIYFAYPDEKICFYGEQAHIDNVKKEVGDEIASLVQWKDIKLPHRHSSFFSRLSPDFKIVKVLLDKLRDNHRNDVLVITGNPSILWALKYYISTSHKNKKIQVVIHGDFSKLRYRASLKHHLNPFYHIGTLNTALRLASDKRIQYIVLEEAIRDAVIQKMPFLENNIYTVDHPVLEDRFSYKPDKLNAPIQFGFLGRTSERKGFSKYLDVASEITQQFKGEVDFHVIGKSLTHNEHYCTEKLDYLSSKPSIERIERGEFIRRLSKLHFVCLFYDKEYEFTASGVLLDSIAWLKPIISTDLPIFRELENKFGDIGYVCKSDKLSETIATILRNKDNERYMRQVDNMLQVKLSRTPKNLSIKYQKIVENE